MEKIIQKGGLMGSCAELYKDDPALSDTFVRECAAWQNHFTFYKFWGQQLAAEIICYTMKYRGHQA